MKNFMLCSLIFNFLLLSGCGVTTTSANNQYSFQQPSSKGLLFLSLTEDGSTPTAFGVGSNLIIKKIGSQNEIVFPDRRNAVTGYPMDPVSDNLIGNVSHFEDVFGRTYFLELDPGEYEISDWRVVSGGGKGYWLNNVYMAPSSEKTYHNKAPISYHFTISKNIITYIGAFNLHFYDKKDFLGFNEIDSANLTIENRLDRDTNAAKSFYPKLDISDIKVDIAHQEQK